MYRIFFAFPPKWSRGFTSSRWMEKEVLEEFNRQKRMNKWMFRGMCIAAAATGTVACLRSTELSLHSIILPFIRTYVDPETAHQLSIIALKLGLTPIDYSIDPPVIQSRVKGVVFFNPIGMAAGFDKQVEAPLEILRLGFGFVEVGTVLPKPQEGNPKPVMFRLPKNEAVINRCGFNSVGLDVALERLKKVRKRQAHDPLTKDFLIGVSVGKNKNGEIISDTVNVVEAVAPYSDYIAVNVSSPNTPNLRDNQRREPLIALVKAVKASMASVKGELAKAGKPYTNTTKKDPLLFIKISPDVTSEELKDIADIALQYNIDGIIATNTTISRPAEIKEEFIKIGEPNGGLSGKPLKELSKKIVYDLYKLTSGTVPIIACGGISSAEDALDIIEAGASLCQVYTALIYEGPLLPSSMKNKLAVLLMQKGYMHLSDAVGARHRQNMVKPFNRE